MIPAKVFLGGAPKDAEILQQLAQALGGLGVPVDTGSPTPQPAPAWPDAAPPALVLVLSAATLALPDFAAGLEGYETLVAENPATVVVPVMLEPLPAENLPLWLREHQPITVAGDSPEASEVIVRGVLQRLGLSEADDATGPVAPLIAATALDTVPLPAMPLDTVPLPAVPLETVPLPAVPLDTVPLPAASMDTASLDTLPLAAVPPDTSSSDTSSLDTAPLVVPPLALAGLDTVPLPAAPAPLTTGRPSPGTLAGARPVSWRQRLERRKRPIAIGAAASLILLLIACVAFSLGVGSPGGRGADRLDSGPQGGSGADLATASPTASALPSASATKPKSTATPLHRTPTPGTPTSGVPTSTPAPPTLTPVPPTSTPVPPTPTPTLGPGTGLHGDYFHSTKFRPGTPVPTPGGNPDPTFGAPWFSQTDPFIYFGYGQQSRTYTPPLGSFDSPVCPSQPGSVCSPFGVRWTGCVRALYTETYTFTTDADDGVKLWVRNVGSNDQPIIDNWQVQADTQRSATISLTADQLVPIKIEYYENGEGPATMALQWSSNPSQQFQPIPQSQLYPSC
jgi:hypothetical protein